MPGPKDSDGDIEFELSDEDLKAISEAKSETVPDEPEGGETPFTIRNAPVAKSVLPPEAFLRDLAEEDDEDEPTDGDDG